MTEEEKKKQAAAVEQGQQPDNKVTPTPSATENGANATSEDWWRPQSYWVQGQNGVEKVSDSDDGIQRTVVRGDGGRIFVNEEQPDGSRKTRYVGMETKPPAGTPGLTPNPSPGEKGNEVISGQQSAVSSQQTPTTTANDALTELERENEERKKRGHELYQSMFRHEESDEERRKREKREKTLKIVAGIHDMTRALANLVGTVRYAPSWYDGNNLSDKAKERYERAKTEREKDKAYNDNLRMVLNKLEGDYNNMKLKIEAEKARRAEAAANRAMRERLAKAAAKEKEENLKRKDDELEERKRHNKETEKTARQNANRPRGGGGSGSGKNTFTFYSPSGKSQITMPPNKATTISVVYDMMDKVHKLDRGKKTPTPNQMWTLINAYLNDTTVDEALRIAAWNRLVSIYKAEEEPKEIKQDNSKVPPSKRNQSTTDNSKVPPSKRK